MFLSFTKLHYMNHVMPNSLSLFPALPVYVFLFSTEYWKSQRIQAQYCGVGICAIASYACGN